MDADVLVVGAGPVGLLLAAELKLAGAEPLVVERLAEPNPDRKARGIGPLAAEALRRRGLADQLAKHHEAGLADLRRDHGSELGHFAHLHKIDLVPPDEPDRERSLIWQPELERVLAEHAAALGVTVLRGASLTGLVQRDDAVVATVGERSITASYLVGCDGGRSTVRKLVGFEFPGTEPLLIIRAGVVELADPGALPPAGRRSSGDLLHGFRPGVPDQGPGMLGTSELAAATDRDSRDPLTADELAESVRRVAGAEVSITSLNNGRRFADNARQAATYRLGRVLLAGDAAHVHSPNGGQGLNLGLMDAVNLGWKLAATVTGTAPDALLDSYTAERHPVAAAVLHNTRAQSALLLPGPHTDALRDIVSDLMDLPQANAYFAELLTGLHHSYPMPYAGTRPHPLLGQHCPDLTVTTGGRETSLYALAEAGAPLLLHGAEDREVAEAAAPWADRVTSVAATAIGGASLTAALTAALVRPDGVLAWAAPAGSPIPTLRAALEHWFGRR